MDTPRPGSAGGAAVTTKVLQRGGANAASAEPTPATAQTLKHVYSGITLTREHLATVLGCLRDCCRTVDIHANTFHLTDLDQLEAVFSEDKIIERLRITATDPHDGEMSLIFELGYIEIEASNASWSPAFTMIVRLLEGIPKNGTTLCGITMRRSAIVDSPPSAPTAPLVPVPSTPTALAMAAISAAAKPLPGERSRTQAGDRQRTVGSSGGTARTERPREAVAAAAPRQIQPQAPSSSPAPVPAAMPVIAPAPVTAARAAAAPDGRVTIMEHAPMLLHLAGDLALVGCVALNWRRIVDGFDLATAVCVGIAALCVCGAVAWTLARAWAARPAPRS
jgi:hypothetical protein